MELWKHVPEQYYVPSFDERRKKAYQIVDSKERTNSLGNFAVLPELIILKIFKILDARDMLPLSSVSKLFFALNENDHYWKRQCVRYSNGDFRYQGSWRRTYISLIVKKDLAPIKVHIQCTGIISPILYSRWYRAHRNVDQWANLTNSAVERRSNLSLKDFIEEYDKKNKPVIITDVVPKWKAATEWTKEKLIKRFGNHKFKTDEVDAKAEKKLYIGLEDYFRYHDNHTDEDPIYMFDDKFHTRKETEGLLNEYVIPPYFKEDFFELLEDERPPYRWIVIGPKGSGSPFHIDPYRTSAWNGLISGRKRWALYPYEKIPPGIEIDWDKDGNFESDSPEHIKWMVEVYPKLKPSERPIECILEGGEMIFVPSGWWHQVVNLTDTVAVTQNVCNQQNLGVVSGEIKFDDDICGNYLKRK